MKLEILCPSCAVYAGSKFDFYQKLVSPDVDEV